MSRPLRPALLIVLILSLTACGAAPGVVEPVAIVPTESTAPPPGDGVMVVATGTMTTAPDGSNELCPPGWTQPCPGIEVVSDVPIPEVPIVSLTGRYDGASIVVSGGEAAEWADAADIDFTTPCEDLRDGVGAPQAADAGVVAVNRLIAKSGIPVGGSWWDQANGVYTVWLVGDPEEHRSAIESAAGEMPVCVTGGAQWTQKELEKTQRGAMRRLEPTGMMWYSSTVTFGNRAVLVVEAIDQKQLGDIERRFDGRVEVDAFIELLEDDLSDLPAPVPAHPGDLPIATAQTRMGGGMMALGTFTLRFDRQRECLYLKGSGPRTVPTWPFGYSADANPGRVYDFDGNLVVRQGDRFQIGGGFVSVDLLPPGSGTCGAPGTFIASGPPEVISAP